MKPSPRVFVSHASEDRERFVERFAKRLRENGVDAWTSFWEMKPGDSLVDKIFEDGLGRCNAMIVVLSTASVEKKWVREELNAGMVKQIEGNTKLIPIRLDGCNVPECLKNRIWQDIQDLESYDREFEQVLNAIYGMYEKPPLGTPPTYVQHDVAEIEDLTRVDSIIFEAACRKRLEQGMDPHIDPEWLIAAMAEKGISEEQIRETQEILENRGYIEVSRSMGPPRLYGFRITSLGFDQFAHVGIPDYTKICAAVGVRLVRNENMDSKSMAEVTEQPLALVQHIFESLACNALVKYSSSWSGMRVYWVSAELRRQMEGNN